MDYSIDTNVHDITGTCVAIVHTLLRGLYFIKNVGTF